MKYYFKALFCTVATVIAFHCLLVMIVMTCNSDYNVVGMVIAEVCVFFISAIVSGGLIQAKDED